MNHGITMPVIALATWGIVQLAALLIWGATLSNRVKQVERDVEPLRLLGLSVARVEARIEGMIEQLKDLNASIRWMRGGPVDSGGEAGD